MSYEIPTILSRRGRRQRVRERAHLQAMIRERHLAPSVRRAAFMFMGASQLLKLFSSSQRQRLLFDDHPGAAAGYSLRRLSWDVANAIRVREDGGNTEADIGFLGVDLDTVQLLLHTGANSGFLPTWYDQSGNARNATQATSTAQPRIVNAGVLETQDGKAAVYFIAKAHRLNATTSGIVSSAYTCFLCDMLATSTPSACYLWGNTTGANYHNIHNGYANSTLVSIKHAFDDANYSYNSSSSARRLHTQLYSRPGSSYWINGAFLGSAATPNQGGSSTNNLGIGGSNQGNYDGHIQEMILYPSDQSASRTAIEANVNSYWEIY